MVVKKKFLILALALSMMRCLSVWNARSTRIVCNSPIIIFEIW